LQQGHSARALRWLDFTANPIDLACAASLAELLRTASTLERLDLSDCVLDNPAATALAAGLPAARSLRELRLGHTFFGVAGVTGLSACPTFRLLDVSTNKSFGNAGIAALAPALAPLHTLNATDCGLTSESAIALAAMVESRRKLHTLLLGHNLIGVGMATLSAVLQSSSTLSTLELGCCRVDTEGAVALAEALRRGWAVTDLRLDDNARIGDAGALALAAAMNECGYRCNLRELSLSSCRLSPVAAFPLVHAGAHVPTLRLLSVRDNRALQTDTSVLAAACGLDSHFAL
jgi:Ran GTPase-activating protein (RanGAP) involved in mRNA processing and transport